MNDTDELPPLRDVIRRHGISAKKSLGQHFILDPNLTASHALPARSRVRACSKSDRDRAVLRAHS
jgi:hypothetical protein